MSQPVLNVAARRLGYRFMCAEAAWILSGDNRVETIAPYSKSIGSFSDDGLFFYGAYGPKVVDQLSYVVGKLSEATDTRQAVINIWREKPAETRDVPCTLSLQFQLRGQLLHCAATMRSSDAWLGVPYDIFNFAMLTGYVCLLIRSRCGRLATPGMLCFTAGNQHLYEKNLAAAQAILADVTRGSLPLSPVGLDRFNPLQFDTPQALIDHLWALARGQYGDGLYLSKELRGYYDKNRPTRDELFTAIARLLASRSTCARRQVGCVLADKAGHVLATGYNGPAAGLPHCTEAPCAGAEIATGVGLEVCEAVHAEQNALLQCQDVYSIDTCYVTCSPCLHCAKMLLNTSTRRIAFLDRYEGHFLAVTRLWVDMSGRSLERVSPLPLAYGEDLVRLIDRLLA
jgi:dCMP deaminase